MVVERRGKGKGTERGREGEEERERERERKRDSYPVIFFKGSTMSNHNDI